MKKILLPAVLLSLLYVCLTLLVCYSGFYAALGVLIPLVIASAYIGTKKVTTVIARLQAHNKRLLTLLGSTRTELNRERIKYRAKEEEKSVLKKVLTQNIAHELKTPVSSIRAYLETIVENPNLTPEKAETFLLRSYTQSKRLSHLLRDISLLTRMDEAPDMVEMEQVNIGDTLQMIIQEVHAELEEKDIRIDMQLPPSPIIRGNPSLIYSIFRNLTDNSIAYAGRGVQINISMLQGDDRLWHFTFADTGVGIDSQHLERIFERFYRVDKGRSRKAGGTGLGLAIVKNAILIHGGNICAKSKESGGHGGVEFEFTLGG